MFIGPKIGHWIKGPKHEAIWHISQGSKVNFEFNKVVSWIIKIRSSCKYGRLRIVFLCLFLFVWWYWNLRFVFWVYRKALVLCTGHTPLGVLLWFPGVMLLRMLLLQFIGPYLLVCKILDNVIASINVKSAKLSLTWGSIFSNSTVFVVIGYLFWHLLTFSSSWSPLSKSHISIAENNLKK